MLIGDVSAVRPGAADQPGHAPALGPAPLPPLQHVRRSLTPRRIAASVALTLALHVVFAGLFVLAWHSMVRDIEAPRVITAELVSSVPGDPPKKAAQEPKPPPPPQPAAQPPTPEPKPPEPKPPEPKPPEPKPPEPEAAKAPPAPTPPSAQTALEEALRSPLREPPPEAKPSAAQADTNQLGNASTETTASKEAPAGSAQAPPQTTTPVPPAAPAVLSSSEGKDIVPAPAPKPPESKPPTPPAAGDPTGAARNATAKLSAALATASLPMPASFRAALSARGTSDTSDYRGSVFGALSRAREAVNDEARARHLKGQVVLAIVLTAAGAIDKLSVLQSSGHPDSDAFAIDMVRRSAPFPPPPPGASHSFTPAITFGDE